MLQLETQKGERGSHAPVSGGPSTAPFDLAQGKLRTSSGPPLLAKGVMSE
jgi:hypothetical protein